jgi:hypothetical protein
MTRQLTLIFGLVGAVALTTGACTSSGGNHGQQDAGPDDAIHQFDLGQHDSGGDDAAATCTGTGHTAAVHTAKVNAAALYYTGDTADPTGTAPYDRLTVELYYGLGGAEPLMGPGTVQIGATAADKNYGTCTTCVRLLKNCTASGGCTKVYLATEGTITITEFANGGDFVGSMTDVKLQEVTIAQDGTYTSTPVTNGTWWCVDSFSFSTPLVGTLPCTTSDDCPTDLPLCDTPNATCVECLSNTECASNANGQLCGGGMCGACASALDCTSPAAPLCATNATTGRPECVAGGTCTGDDSGEPGDDGPNGARLLTVSVGMSAAVCLATDGSEYDFYEIVTAAAGNISISVSWADAGADLDFLVLDSALTTVKSATSSTNPETVALTGRPAGTYYVGVYVYDMGTATAAIPYTITYTTP